MSSVRKQPNQSAIPGGRLIDARGRACPMPVLMLAKAARGAERGGVLVLLATDPAAEPDVAAWCAAMGHTLERVERGPDGVRIRVVLGLWVR